MNSTKLYRFVLLFLICWGAHAWFTWSLDYTGTLRLILLIVMNLITIKYVHDNRVDLSPNAVKVFAAICILFTYCRNGVNVQTPLLFFLRHFPLYVLWCDWNHASEHIAFLKKALAYIIAPGLLIYLSLYVIHVSGLTTIAYPGNSNYIFDNYIFVIQNVNEPHSGLFRFCSIFLEPGYFGTLISFLLIADGFKYNDKYTRVLLIGLIASVSLAGYITTFIGYVLYNSIQGLSVKKYLYIGVVLAAAYGFGVNYNNGDNFINRGIIERLQPDEDRGISGNNRAGEFALAYFEDLVTSGEIWWGIGYEGVQKVNGGDADSGDYYNQIRGAGYVIYFITNGVICAILWLLAYLFMGPLSPYANKKYGYCFVLIIILTFIEAGVPSSYSWIIPFILGCNANRLMYE